MLHLCNNPGAPIQPRWLSVRACRARSPRALQARVWRVPWDGRQGSMQNLFPIIYQPTLPTEISCWWPMYCTWQESQSLVSCVVCWLQTPCCLLWTIAHRNSQSRRTGPATYQYNVGTIENGLQSVQSSYTFCSVVNVCKKNTYTYRVLLFIDILAKSCQSMNNDLTDTWNFFFGGGPLKRSSSDPV